MHCRLASSVKFEGKIRPLSGSVMLPVPDVVRRSKLETEFDSKTLSTTHIRHVSENKASRAKVRQKETWKHERSLGRGNFGLVSLETCIHGQRSGDVRAVKKLEKLQSGHYLRELEAIALFSNEKLADEEVSLQYTSKSGISPPKLR